MNLCYTELHQADSKNMTWEQEIGEPQTEKTRDQRQRMASRARKVHRKETMWFLLA